MNQEINNFVIFNDKNIVYRRIKGVFYIGIKSVCEAIKVDYIQQFKNVQNDPILGPALCKHTMQIPNDQPRNLSCLPENLVYGWIFSIKSNSPELLEYKRDCYEILFNHFHGTITKRAELYKEISREKKKIKDLEIILKGIPEYAELLSSKMREARLWKNIHTTTDNESDLFSDDEFE